ncbi:MAG: hypothetical protein KIS66_12325 [Fimbriimonadaceae bacterium]|nr:hypothetical protein [Fimbriimonadaceae bacterium]
MTFALFLAAHTGTRPSLLDHAWTAFRADPAVRIEDAYKWLYHATMGGEHAITSDDAPRTWFQNEWNSLSDIPNAEPLVVSLRPDGGVLRVNLRSYKRAGRDPEMLFEIFVASARAFRSDRTGFLDEWRGLGERLRRTPLGHLTHGEWFRLERATAPRGYPAIHHSAPYESIRRPAYRVIVGALWQ